MLYGLGGRAPPFPIPTAVSLSVRGLTHALRAGYPRRPAVDRETIHVGRTDRMNFYVNMPELRITSST